ncbi:MAG: fucose isomerase, partial [Anaerolineae bacterium]|nr:fucose isomerase [Anaerolineae bacterium]
VKLEQITTYVPTEGVPNAALLKMAKLGLVIDDWMTENHLVASALQCWTA